VQWEAATSAASHSILQKGVVMAEEISKSGVFIDTKTGKVVESQPEEGVQLVAPGGVVTPEAERQIKAAKAGGDTSTAGAVDLSAKDAAQDSAAAAAVPTVTTGTTKRR
jgi:hypothetical protein